MLVSWRWVRPLLTYDSTSSTTMHAPLSAFLITREESCRNPFRALVSSALRFLCGLRRGVVFSARVVAAMYSSRFLLLRGGIQVDLGLNGGGLGLGLGIGLGLGPGLGLGLGTGLGLGLGTL